MRFPKVLETQEAVDDITCDYDIVNAISQILMQNWLESKQENLYDVTGTKQNVTRS